MKKLKLTSGRTVLQGVIGVGLLVAVWFVSSISPNADTTTTASFQAEAGTKTGVTTVSDSSAAGGSAVQFGQIIPPPTTGFCDTSPALPSVKPTASNTGVPVGTTLSPSGSITITVAGTVIDAKDITGSIAVNANNVTIKNSKIKVSGYYGVTIGNGVTGTKIINNEIYTTSGGYVGLFVRNAFVCGNYIHGFENPMTVDGGMMIQANYIDKLQGNQAEPHYDGIEIYGGGAATKVWGNNIYMTDTSGDWLGDTGAINLTAWAGNISDVEIHGNWLGGGTYTLYVDEQGGYNATNVRITNNRWYRNSYVYGTHLIRDNSSVTTWTSNVFDDTSQAIAK
jgi:hypothetical protein